MAKQHWLPDLWLRNKPDVDLPTHQRELLRAQTHDLLPRVEWLESVVAHLLDQTPEGRQMLADHRAAVDEAEKAAQAE